MRLPKDVNDNDRKDIIKPTRHVNTEMKLVIVEKALRYSPRIITFNL